MGEKTDFRKRIIVALDVDKGRDALSLISQLEGAEIFKVGLRLFTAEGPPLLRKIKVLRKKIFLDLKLHDIPNTAAEAVRAAARHGVEMMTLHISGGGEMLARAREAAESEAQREGGIRPLLLGVTVLTSLNDDELKELGIAEDTKTHVLRLAKLAREHGLDGVVCSAQEISLIKRGVGKDFRVVVPGIRPYWASAHDQKRIMTPSEAVKRGADYLVVGRPIIEAPSPQRAFFKIVEELNRTVNRPDSKNKL